MDFDSLSIPGMAQAIAAGDPQGAAAEGRRPLSPPVAALVAWARMRVDACAYRPISVASAGSS